ncbi:MAG: hypothetical protein KatS3mg026_1770 [Bacteroidia bacterium]|nr:MAG: hypothetical protein KatS3mg026_1770 [Bacteroidia bacterium]
MKKVYFLLIGPWLGFAQVVGIGTVNPIWHLTVEVPSSTASSSPANAGIGVTGYMPAGDNTQGIIALHWNNASTGYTWRLWLADPDGGFGVLPNGLELWEYPPSGPCCRPRLRFYATRNLPFSYLPVTITTNHWVEAYNFINISDSTQKIYEGPLAYGIREVLRLRPVYYRWRHAPPTYPPHIGFLAQEVEAVLPEAVYTLPDNTKAIDYAALIAVLLHSYQQISSKVEKIEQEISIK